MGDLIKQLAAPLIELAKNQQVWVIAALFGIFVYTIQRVESYIDGPWPHQRRGDDRFNPLAPGSRSAWLAVAILLLPGMLLALVNTGVRFMKGIPSGGPVWSGYDSLHWMGWGLVMLVWFVFVAGSANVLHIGQYLRRVGLITPVALVVCLVLGDLLLLLSLLEAAPLPGGR